PETTRPELLGDAPPLGLLLALPQGSVYIPRPRGFKISDNENPSPQTRTYFSFNQFNNVYARVNRHLGNDVRDVNVARATMGVDIAVCDDCYSFGIRQQVNTVSARSATFPELNGSHTTNGDMSFIFKALLCELEEGDVRGVLSGGLAVTPPTGNSSLFN